MIHKYNIYFIMNVIPSTKSVKHYDQELKTYILTYSTFKTSKASIHITKIKYSILKINPVCYNHGVNTF